jgi:hypothetical protein
LIKSASLETRIGALLAAEAVDRAAGWLFNAAKAV